MRSGKYNAQQYFDLVKRGQDEMVEFLKTKKVEATVDCRL